MFLELKIFFLLTLGLFPYFQSCCDRLIGFLLQRYHKVQALRVNTQPFSPSKNYFLPVHWLLTNIKGSIQCEQLEMDELHFRKTLKKKKPWYLDMSTFLNYYDSRCSQRKDVFSSQDIIGSESVMSPHPREKSTHKPSK